MPTFHKDPLKRLLAEVKNNEDERRKRQEKHEISYQQALIATREKIKQTEGPDMKERLQDQIRQWFIECRCEGEMLLDIGKTICLVFSGTSRRSFRISQTKTMVGPMPFSPTRISMNSKKNWTPYVDSFWSMLVSFSAFRNSKAKAKERATRKVHHLRSLNGESVVWTFLGKKGKKGKKDKKGKVLSNFSWFNRLAISGKKGKKGKKKKKGVSTCDFDQLFDAWRRSLLGRWRGLDSAGIYIRHRDDETVCTHLSESVASLGILLLFTSGWSVDFWETRDEANNFEQNYDSEIVKEEKRVEVVEEVRLEVDALMREELKNLKTVGSPRTKFNRRPLEHF